VPEPVTRRSRGRRGGLPARRRPHHVQIGRVLDGGLDATVAWAGAPDDRLDFRLLWPEPLVAVARAGRTDKPVPAGTLRVLVDADLTSWQAWNDYATEFADATGARVVHIDDGGIAGPRVPRSRALRLNAPVLMSPKRYTDTLPARLRTRPVVDPCPLWCWSLVTRADDERETIAVLREHASTVARRARTPYGSRRADLAPFKGPAPSRNHISTRMTPSDRSRLLLAGEAAVRLQRFDSACVAHQGTSRLRHVAPVQPARGRRGQLLRRPPGAVSIGSR
jgi:hypothetical protein